MKTKEQLLKKYEGNKEYYDVIKAHYGSKESFQDYDGSILSFDKESMKDIVGAEKLSYEDYIDIQIRTGPNYRGSFMLCYYYTPMGFKGEVETFGKGTICFKRIYVDGMYPDGQCFEGKESHVWMPIKGFNGLNKGDCVEFFAEAYRYIKTGNGKRLDYGLRNPENVKKIEPYELPSDDDLIMQEIDGIICESCYLYDNCSRTVCIRNPKERKQLKKQMFEMIKNSKKEK